MNPWWDTSLSLPSVPQTPTSPSLTGKVRPASRSSWNPPASAFSRWPFISASKTFGLCLSLDNTANILTRRGGFSRREMSMYFLPVVISDNDYPIQSSTSTLIVRVCACDRHGNMQSCSPEVLPFSDGLTTGALVAILLCVIILLSKCKSLSRLWPQKQSQENTRSTTPKRK